MLSKLENQLYHNTNFTKKWRIDLKLNSHPHKILQSLPNYQILQSNHDSLNTTQHHYLIITRVIKNKLKTFKILKCYKYLKSSKIYLSFITN